ncbi:EamA family transporter [Motiliproteus sp.]|uniref:EamA family transporter n=1 Tax=Motiliproteus sp. TaxID=1898955 RepID=UPI003BA92B6E
MSINPIVVAAGQVTASTVLMIPMTLMTEGAVDLASPSLATWLSIIALAVLSTAVAYVIYFKLLASAGATNLLLVTLLVPVSAILLGSVFLGETLGLIHLIGIALIALGLSAIDGRLWRRRLAAGA